MFAIEASQSNSVERVEIQAEMLNPEPKRRWFQFRLRTLLAVVTALGPVCGYLTWQANIVIARKSLLSEVERYGGGYWVPTVPAPFKLSPKDITIYELPIAEIGNVRGVPHFVGDLTDNCTSKGPSMIRRWLGDEAIEFIQLPTGTDRKVEEQFEIAFPEAVVE